MNKKGFTLIELLVVIAIIGLLSSIVLVSLNTARAKARDTRRMSDLKQFQTALELCYDKRGKYDVSTETIITTPCNRERFVDGDFVAAWQTKCGEFMGTIPNDPKGGADYLYTIHTTADYQHYVLLANMETDNYTMTSAEVANFVDSVGITNWEPCAFFDYVIGY